MPPAAFLKRASFAARRDTGSGCVDASGWL